MILPDAVCEDHNFARQFGAYLPKLRKTGNVFAHDMAALYKEIMTAFFSWHEQPEYDIVYIHDK